VKPPRPEGRGFASRAYAPGKEDKHFCIAPLDPALKDGGSALRHHFVRGERTGQGRIRNKQRITLRCGRWRFFTFIWKVKKEQKNPKNPVNPVG
jgi:hypothetical protein